MIKLSIEESIEVKRKIIENVQLIEKIEKSIELIASCFLSGNRLWLCGNGGSAADAQHLAAEFSGRYKLERPPLPAESLTTNTSYITAVANDYDFSQIFSRLIRAQGRSGDILIALSTSGNSVNVLKAAETARSLGLQIIALTGAGGGQLAQYAHILIDVPSHHTPRIQEAHIMIGHIICEEVEKKLFHSK
ncbi:MAG: D-sedoheptulose 7-phosphate isomerase [Bacteroidales bacterium]|nr:D-sedoheptulose 7-phosphate isomerase [Bacteroidales bacterium]